MARLQNFHYFLGDMGLKAFVMNTNQEQLIV